MNAQIRREAIEWLIEFSEGNADRAICKAFNEWLRTSPEHVRAYLQLAAFWDVGDKLNPPERTSVDELVRRAAAEATVLRLPVAPEPQSHRPPAYRRRRVATIAAGVLCVALAVGWLVQSWPRPSDTYATNIGEQRSVILADGSVVTLDALSSMRVRFEPSIRRIELLRGQALFRVAKNAARPFIVQSGATLTRAVGTQFDVNLTGSGTVVTVVEGKVSVSSLVKNERERPVEVLLSAGEQTQMRELALNAPKVANVAHATAWTEGRLEFDSTPLADVIDSFNRYNHRRLVVMLPELASTHITGAFETSNTDKIVSFLQQRFALMVQETDTEIRLTRP